MPSSQTFERFILTQSLRASFLSVKTVFGPLLERSHHLGLMASKWTSLGVSAGADIHQPLQARSGDFMFPKACSSNSFLRSLELCWAGHGFHPITFFGALSSCAIGVFFFGSIPESWIAHGRAETHALNTFTSCRSDVPTFGRPTPSGLRPQTERLVSRRGRGRFAREHRPFDGPSCAFR